MTAWYLLYCKKGELARAKSHLENQGVNCYYPEAKIEKIVRGKRKVVIEPLFSSYMFVQFDYELGPSFTTVRSTRGVADFVRLGAYPQQISPELIASLKATEELQPSVIDELPKKGQAVKINRGQFEGLEAIYQEPDGEVRSLLLIKLINQLVPVKVENKDIDIL